MYQDSRVSRHVESGSQAADQRDSSPSITTANGHPTGETAALILLDASARVTRADRAFYGLCQIDPKADLVGQPFYQYCESPETFDQQLSTAREYGQWTGELRCVTSHGHVIEATASVLLVPGEVGGACSFACSLTNAQALQITRESQVRPRLALESANQGLYDLNVQTGECVVSDEYVEMLGYDPEHFVESNSAWLERLHPDDHAICANTYTDYVAGLIKDYRVEFRQRMQDGRWLWILSIGKIIEWDEAGQPLRMIGTHTDISDIKEAQEILNQDAERRRLALSSASQGIWDLNVVTGDCYTNDDYVNMLGYDTDTFVESYESWVQRMHPDDQARSIKAYRDSLESEDGNLRVEYRHKHANGAWVWILSIGRVVEFDKRGQPLRMIGTCTNISDMKAAQDLIQREAERPRLALSSTKQGFYDCNVQTGKVMVSKEFAEMLGYEPEEMWDISTAWSSHLHPDDTAASQKRFHDHLDGRTAAYSSEFRVQHKGGHYVWILSNGSIIERDKQGNALRFVGTHTDITQTKTAQQDIERRKNYLVQIDRQNLANGLASVVAHELNQPLCAVVNHLGALQHQMKQQSSNTDAICRDAQDASDAAHRAANIIRRFRALFAKREPQTQRCNLLQLIQQGMELMTGVLESNCVKVNIDAKDQDYAITADPILLQQVVMNLAKNAVEAMAETSPDDKQLTFSIVMEHESNEYIISVTDSGPGFRDEAVRHLFEANYSSKANGLGMGLCICRLIVRAHGGAIQLIKTNAQGSTLQVRLPCICDAYQNSDANEYFTAV